MKHENGDVILDTDFALAKIGINHRDMELADAFYMIQKHNDSMNNSNRMPEDDDGD